ncbi:MAG: hypothetical protein EPN88_11490 [Bacteroidetes bacterium]|nr:MAG: hypothetical protein EPN88_11490 [Bacteroidota bacterium]
MKMNLLNLRNFILVFLTGLILSACSKDKTPTDNLIGTWTAGTSTFTAMVGDKTLTQYFTDVMGLTAAEAQQHTNLFDQGIQQSLTGTIQIKSDGKYKSSIGGTTDSGTWSLSSDGKKLTITSDTQAPMTFDVIELTSSKLILNVSESESEDLNGDGTLETISISINMTLTK